MFQTEILEENTHFVFDNFFSSKILSRRR